MPLQHKLSESLRIQTPFSQRFGPVLSSSIAFLIGAAILGISADFSFAFATGESLLSSSFLPTVILLGAYYLTNGFLLTIVLYFLISLMLFSTQLWTNTQFAITLYQIAVVSLILGRILFGSRIFITRVWLQRNDVAFTRIGWKLDVGFQIIIISLFMIVALFGADNNKTLPIYIYLSIIVGVGLGCLLYSLKNLAVNHTRERSSNLAGLDVLFSPLDAQFAGYLSGRLTGLFIILAIYTYVITSFAAIYYYIDHCDASKDLCYYVDSSPMNRKWMPEREGWKNFSITPERTIYGVDSATNQVYGNSYSKISVFLPYLYFSVVTTTTVGYGDVYPISVTAVWFVILHHIVSIVLLIGVAGQVAGFSIRRSFNP